MNNESKERSVKQLPVWLLAGLLMAFLVQVLHQYISISSVGSEFQQLPQPYSVNTYQALSQGSEKLWSYLLLLKVQLHDNQRGRHENYQHLDYKILSEWLLTLGELNKSSDYAAFLASRVYSQIKDKEKIRMMIDVIDKMFELQPEIHWKRMTEACLLAKHELRDLPLALNLADKVARLPGTIKIPYWARDMKIILLDELDQLQSAQILISSMLESGSIRDGDEVRFLKHRLLKIQQKMLNDGQVGK